MGLAQAVDLMVPLIAALVIAAVAMATGMIVGHLAGWRPAGPLAVIAATPLVPRVPIAVGFSLDDVLPVVGVALLLMMVPLRAWPPRRLHAARIGVLLAVVGVGLLVIAGVVSSWLNAASPEDGLRLLLRSSGRFAFLVLIAWLVAQAVRGRVSGHMVAARGLAVVGVAEAAFGLFAFLVPLPDRIGLAGTRPWSVLFGEVPGRISGTLGLSPNFTGTVLMLSVLVTVGLAARPVTRFERAVWLGAALLQLTALALTFSRAPLAAAFVGLVILAIVVSRPVLLLPLAGLVSALAFLTPLAGRFFSDVTDRLALWYSAALMTVDHPLAGVGAGRMLEVMRTMPARYMDTPFGRAVNNAHNTILLPAAELGIVGGIGAALLNVGLATLSVIGLLRVRRDRANAHVVAGCVALLAFLVQGMVNNLFVVGVTSVMGAFVAGAFVLPAVLWPQERSPTAA